MSAAREKDTEKKVPVFGRYETVALAKEWLSALMHSDENKAVGPSELVKKALDDVRSGAVSPEEIQKAASKVKSAPAPAAAAEEEKEKKE